MRDLRQLFQDRIRLLSDAIALSQHSNNNEDDELWLMQANECVEQLDEELKEFSQYLAAERNHLHNYNNGLLMEIREMNGKLLAEAKNFPPLPAAIDQSLVHALSKIQVNDQSDHAVQVAPIQKHYEPEEMENSENISPRINQHNNNNNNNNTKPAIKSYQRQLDPLTLDELQSVPKYITNRLTFDKINEAIKNFNMSLQEKYRNMKIPQQKMNKEMRQRFWAYKESENTETKGRTFVTENDIKTSGKASKFRMDPTGRALVAILRHCGRIKESRGAGNVRYIVTDRNQSPLEF